MKRLKGRINWELLLVLLVTALFWLFVVLVFNLDTGSI
jgi:hypothetical protein